VIVLAECGALGLLSCFVGAQHRDGGAIQRDGALAAGGLRRAQHQAAVVLLELAGDDRGGAVEVDVAPAQPGRLAPAQPAQRDQMVGGVEPVAADGVQESCGLRRRPHRHRRTDPGALPLRHPRCL